MAEPLLLHDLFKKARQCMLTVNAENVITQAYPPQDEEFLGSCTGKVLTELIDFSVDHFNPEDSLFLADVLCASGKTVSCIIRYLPSSGENTQAFFIEEASAILSLIRGRDRLLDVNKQLSERRTMELNGANDLLEKRAEDLKKALEEIGHRNRELAEELQLASELQKSLLPRDFPTDMPIELVHRYMPMARIGGDFFDIVRLSEDKLGVIIIDVSGHGVAPAFITAMFKSAFDLHAPQYENPAELLTILNHTFVKMITTEHYLTAFYMVIDTKEMKCVYSSAGHPKQLLLRESGEVIELSSAGFFVGMFDSTKYENEEVTILPGDLLCCFSDGIIETVNEKGDQFGREGIIAALKSAEMFGLEAQADSVIRGTIDFMHGSEFQDDITLIALQFIESL